MSHAEERVFRSSCASQVPEEVCQAIRHGVVRYKIVYKDGVRPKSLRTTKSNNDVDGSFKGMLVMGSSCIFRSIRRGLRPVLPRALGIVPAKCYKNDWPEQCRADGNLGNMTYV